MYDYIKGTVEQINSTTIVIENNGIGYLIYTPNPYSFLEKKEVKVYLYQQIKEEDNSLFGFKSEEEKEMFLKLISVKGLGCKIALPILATGSIPGIVDAIERENILYLKKFPKIGEKLAKQIILDLKGKLNVVTTDNIVVDTKEELLDALKGLGYKEKEIKNVIIQVDSEKSIEEQIKESLKLLLK